MFIELVFQGLVLGLLYTLMALGFSLLFSILQVINFAHGTLFMSGAILATTLIAGAGLPFLPAVAIAVIGGGVLAVVVEWAGIAPIRKRKMPKWMGMISTFALALTIDNLAHRLFGTHTRPFQPPVELQTYSIMGVQATNLQITVLAIAVIAILALFIFVRYTWLGLGFRAIAEDEAVAGLMGVNVQRSVRIAFFVAGTLAAVAGILSGMYFNMVDVSMGGMAGLKGFVATVVGGLGNTTGAVLGGLLLGFVEVMGMGYIGSSVKDIIAFVVLMVALLVRPTGLLGRGATQ